MKNVNALLNSLLSTQANPSTQSQSQNPISSKGNKPNGGTFGSVLAQVSSSNTPANQGNASQNQPASVSSTGNASTGTILANAVSATNNTGGTSATSFSSVSQTSIAVKESLNPGTANQLAQAEQALVSLAGGLAQLIQMISHLQQSEPQQAQVALASLNSMNLTPAGLQSILNTLQPLVQKLPDDQNPLLLPSSQQAGLLNQMFQQMMQAQQVLMGGGIPNPSNNSTISSLGAAAQTNEQNAALQMFFSNSNLTGIAQNQVQSSQVFINLENFKMSATFIQPGAGVSASQNQSPAATSINSQNVINELNQILANLGNTNSAAITATTQTATVSATGSQNNLSQNFNGLVQLLMQSSVTQAALTSFINNQQRGGANLNSQTASQNAGPTVSANNLTQVSPTSSEIQPVIPAALTEASTNHANAGQSAFPAENNFAVNEIISRAPIPVVQTSVSGNSQTSKAQISSNIPPVFNVSNDNLSVNVTPLQTATPRVQTTENGNTQPANVTENTQVPNTSPTQFAQVMASEIGFGADTTKEINALNAVVASLNVSALHSTQGSLSIGTNTALPSSALTMGQILGASEANQISSGSIVVPNGNPSVPLVPPVPLQPPLPTSNANNVFLSQLNQSQELQPKTQPPTTTGSQAAAVLSAISPEPVNPTIQPLVPGVQTVALNNSTATNGVVILPIDLNNGLSATPTTVGPTLSVAGSNASNTPASNNPIVNNPLPLPVTLPNSGTTPPPASDNPSTPRFTAPTNLNQTGNPAPTSQAPAVPALASAGEVLKSEIPTQTVGNNNNNNPQTGVTTSQPASTIKPSSPEAVSPVVPVSETDSSMSISDVSGKDTPNNSTVLVGNTLLASNTYTPNQGHGSSVFSLGVATPSTAGSTGSIDSAQVLNQILQQVAAQTADAKTISRLNFQLVPESLGKVTVQIALIDQSVSARMIVTNPEIKEVLQSHMVDLKAALNQAGLQIDQLQVQVQGGGGNLLAQYYQYQQEGSGYRLPASFVPVNGPGSPDTENTSNLALFSIRTSLVNVLA